MSVNIVEAVKGFLSADKDVRTQCSEVLEKGEFSQIVSGLLDVIDMNDEDSSALAAVILRNRLVKEERNISKAIEQHSAEMNELKENLSNRILAYYKLCNDVTIRSQVVNCISAICGIFHGNDVWVQLFTCIEEQLGDDKERLIEGLSLIEKLSEYANVREVLLTVGVQFLSAVDVALKHDDPEIFTQAAETVAAFLEHFVQSPKFNELCAMVPTLVEVCVMKGPSLRTLVAFNYAMTNLDDIDKSISEFVSSPVPILEALHVIYANKDEDDETRGVAMRCFASVLASCNEWASDAANKDLVIQTMRNVIGVIASCIEEQWDGMKDDADPEPSENDVNGTLLDQALETINTIIQLVATPETVLESVIFEACREGQNPQNWATAYAGYQALDTFIIYVPDTAWQCRHAICQEALPFLAQVDGPVQFHQWLTLSIMTAIKDMINEVADIDPFIEDLVKVMVPFLVANLGHPVGNVRKRTAAALSAVATVTVQASHYPEVVIKKSLENMAGSVIEKLLESWSVNASFMEDVSGFDDDTSQTVLGQQAEIFAAAGHWCSLYSDKDFPARQQIIEKSIQILDLIGNMSITQDREGSAACMQTALRIATENIANQFYFNFETVVNNEMMGNVIGKLVEIIIRINGLIERDEPFYCTANWRRHLLEALGYLGASGSAFNPFIDVTLPIFLTPLEKRGGDITVCDPELSDDGGCKLVYKEHGLEQAIRVDTSVWDDQRECLWGLKLLLTSRGSEKLLLIGTSIIEALMPLYKSTTVESPIIQNVGLTLAACMGHRAAQIENGIVPPENLAEALSGLEQWITTSLDISRDKVHEVLRLKENDVVQDNLFGISHVQGPIGLVGGIFNTLFKLKEHGVEYPASFTDVVINRVFDEILVPSMKMLMENFKMADQKEEGDSLFEEIEYSPDEFLAAAEEAMCYGLQFAGDKVFHKMRQTEIDVIWVRLAAGFIDPSAKCNVDRMHALVAIAHIMAHGGRAACELYADKYADVVNTVLKADVSEELDLVADPYADNAALQCGIYGMSVLFEKCFDILTDDKKGMMLNSIQSKVFDKPESSHVQRRIVVENAIIAFIFHRLNNNDQPEAVVKYFEQFPVFADIAEIERLSQLLVKMIKAEHPWTLHASLKSYIVCQLEKTLEFEVALENPRLMSDIRSVLGGYHN